MAVNLRGLIAKMNAPTRSAVEGAAGLCLSRTNYDVEIEHLLVKTLDATDNDVAVILKHFGVNRTRLADDLALLQSYAITYVVAKNAGGAGAESKLKAALIQQIPVILIDRPRLPPRQTFGSAKGVMDWIALHSTRLGL